MTDDGGKVLSLPFARDSRTSKDAAESMRSRAQADRERVLDCFRRASWQGATADEVLVATGLSHQSGSARVSELANKLHLIVDSGRTRATRSGRQATVYVMNAQPGLPPDDHVAKPLRPSKMVIGHALNDLRTILADRRAMTGGNTPADLQAVIDWLVLEVRR